ncbi:MAG: hypothetical protein U0989_19375 [Azonexus sp.]|nr:hypothetical protein [Azonexus sp.]
MLDSKILIDQIDAVLKTYSEYSASSKYDDLSDLKREIKNEILTLLAATIDRTAPVGSVYRQQADAAYKQYGRDNSHNITILTGVLRALKADYTAGRLQSITELIHADLFSDFLEMAQHLHSGGYKDAAAVIAGSVLEGHLRKLSEKHGIATEQNDRPKKADAINSELAAAGVYSKLDQKNVTAWLGLRNHAAHGQYAEYTKDQVSLFLQSTSEFLSRHSA